MIRKFQHKASRTNYKLGHIYMYFEECYGSIRQSLSLSIIFQFAATNKNDVSLLSQGLDESNLHTMWLEEAFWFEFWNFIAEAGHTRSHGRGQIVGHSSQSNSAQANNRSSKQYSVQLGLLGILFNQDLFTVLNIACLQNIASNFVLALLGLLADRLYCCVYCNWPVSCLEFCSTKTTPSITC